MLYFMDEMQSIVAQRGKMEWAGVLISHISTPNHSINILITQQFQFCVSERNAEEKITLLLKLILFIYDKTIYVRSFFPYDKYHMNLQYPLIENYHTYKYLEVHRLKDPHKQKLLLISYTSSENDYSALIISKPRANEPILPLNEAMEQIGPYPNFDELKSKIVTKLGLYQSRQITYAYGIVGFHRFLQGYYMTIITEMESIAMIGRHKINEIIKTEIIQLFELRSEHKEKQQKYKQILCEYKLENYYFSYTYDMTHSLAKNMIRNARPFYPEEHKQPPEEQYYSNNKDINNICQLFHFNYEINKEWACMLDNHRWILAIVHGFCRQINVKVKGTSFKIIVIARRCRHHAGTRYIKRGINSDGFVANYVEIQQVVINHSLSQDTRPVCSSFIQMRGSVPTYWMQKPSIATPKPSIQIRSDDYLYLATRKHFHDLVGHYGQHIFCINLMKSREKTIRESGLSKQYLSAVNFINKNDLPPEHGIHYAEIDMKHHIKLDKNMFINKVRTFAYFTLQKTGIFLCLSFDRSTNDQYVEFQNGIMRANCVDCLDRTNSFQQLAGETALAVQISRLMKEDTKFENLQLNETILELYSQLYEKMGDLISVQYGSSLAHKQKIQKTTESRNEFWTSIKRHFNNNLKDYDRQEQIDVFLGYHPDPEGLQIWETKPSIEHFPSARVKNFQNYEDYFGSAFSFFKNKYSLQLFKRIHDKEKFQKSKISHLETFGKEELKNNFPPDVVNGLINERQISYFFKFCLSPNFILEKRVWAQINPGEREKQTMQQLMSKPYNKIENFIKTDKEVKILQLTNNKRFTQQCGQKEGPNSPHKNKSSQKASTTFSTPFLFYEDDEKEDFGQLYEGISQLDQEQMTLVENVLKNQIIGDKEIEEEVKKWQDLLNQTSQVDEIYNKMRVIAEQQIKMIENNYNNKNFLGLEPKAKRKNETLAKKVVIGQQNKSKKNMIKNNKVLMLQKVMKKNFTHGKISTPITQI